MLYRAEIYLFPNINVPLLFYFKRSSKKLGINNLHLEKNFDIISKFLKKLK